MLMRQEVYLSMVAANPSVSSCPAPKPALISRLEEGDDLFVQDLLDTEMSAGGCPGEVWKFKGGSQVGEEGDT